MSRLLYNLLYNLEFGTTSMRKNPLPWGVIRYTGPAIDDRAHFDGWYRDKEDALGVYRWWCEEYPLWTVALVKADDETYLRGPVRRREWVSVGEAAANVIQDLAAKLEKK